MLFTLLAILHFCTAAALVYGIDLLSLIPWRRAHDVHWTERARLLWPARKTNGLLFFAIPASLCAAQASLLPALPLSYLYPAIAGFAGVILGTWPMSRDMFPGMRFGTWVGDVTAAFAIRLLSLGVLVVAGVYMPYHLNLEAIVLTAGVVAFKLWFIWGGVIWLLRIARILVAAPPRLADVVSDVAAQMELPLPRVWLLRGYGANAMAFPAVHTLAVTEGALKGLTDEELGAVCAHEFAHLNESRKVIFVRILAAFALLPGIFLKPAIEAWGPLGYLCICVAVFLISRLTLSLRRRLEKRADSVATAHEGPSPGTYARALERLYEINQVPAVLRGSLTHPNLYDRLLAAGVTPAYSRPAPPAQFTWQQGVLLLLMVASGFGAFCRIEMAREMKRDAIRAHAEREAG